MGAILPMEAPILEGPRGQISYCCIADLADSGIRPARRRRGLPFRPYLHTRISRISGRDRQLPQIIINITAVGAVDRELLYIEVGNLSPPHQQQQQQQRTTTTTINNNNNQQQQQQKHLGMWLKLYLK